MVINRQRFISPKRRITLHDSILKIERIGSRSCSFCREETRHGVYASFRGICSSPPRRLTSDEDLPLRYPRLEHSLSLHRGYSRHDVGLDIRTTFQTFRFTVFLALRSSFHDRKNILLRFVTREKPPSK